jgi:hypothetical protein
MQLAVQQNITGTPYVTSASTTVNFENGHLSLSYTAETVFGQVTGNAATPMLEA